MMTTEPEWRHFHAGDEVRIGGETGRWVFLGVAVQDDGTVLARCRKKSRANWRYFDVAVHEIVDADASFTWKHR